MKQAVGVVWISIAFLAAIFSSSRTFAQERSFRDTLKTAQDSLIALPDEFILPSSISLTIDGISLSPQRDYTIDSSLHFIQLSENLRKLFFSAASDHIVEVKYTSLPLQLHRMYRLHEFIDSGTAGRPTISYTTYPNDTSRNVLSSEKELRLTKSGGITRGIQAGSTQDLTFTNSFNLTFSGDLGNELSFKGALSEESTPLQPEGNTQILRDIDRIYIEMNAGNTFSATLGDYVLNLASGNQLLLLHNPELDPVFTNFSRKVLGAKGDLIVGPTEIIASGSATKGKFTTFSFQGHDAVQGPYQLQGRNGEQDLIVIAGTEHVYIDGVLMTRGEINDYTIDYGLAQLTFTAKRVITSASRVTVDFEYTDEKYSRSLVAASQVSKFFDNKVQFTTSYIREGDDQNSPQTLTLSDSDKMILSQAGADPSKASKSGVVVAGRDSFGRAKGNYARVDTIISGKAASFYRYSPFDTINAVYNVSFGFAGTGKGSYIRKAISEFDFAGAGQGDYDTISYLPLPQLTQIFAGQLIVSPIKSVAIAGELAFSDLHPNRFAPDISIQDKAYRLYSSYFDTIGRFILGAKYSERYKGGNFSTIDRDRSPEELRQYGLDAPTDNYTFISTSERERKLSLDFGVSHAALNLQYGLYTRGTAYHAERSAGNFALREDSTYFPSILISASHVPISDSATGISSTWNSYSAQADKNIFLGRSLLHAGLHYISEERISNSLISDTSAYQSFRYNEISPFASLKLNEKITISALLNGRKDDSVRSGNFIHISDANTYQLSSSFLNLSGFSSQIDIAYRKKEYTDSLSKFLNGGNVSGFLLRLVPRYQSSDNVFTAEGIYEGTEERSAQQQRIFFPVQKGLGNYKYLGDLNHNGKQDPEEFVLARYSDEGDYILLLLPTQQLFPVTTVRSSLRLRFNPLSSFGTETSIRVEETSSDPNSSDIYLFRLSHFLNDSMTIRGLLETQQDFNIMENNSSQSYRLRFLERKNSAQFNTGLEQTYFKELSIRGKFHPGYEISNETTIAHTIDNARSDEHSTNQPHATERTEVKTEWTYEPFVMRYAFGIIGEYSIAHDHSFGSGITSTLNSLTANARYSISNQARLRAEIGRDELDITNVNNSLPLPFSLTQGRSPGATWLWTVSIDIQLASGIVVTGSYNGRSELSDGISRTIIHNARAEVRAAF